MSVAVVSSVVLVYYGMSFGMIKTYLWLSGIITAFIIGLFVSTPARIVVLALFDSIFIKVNF